METTTATPGMIYETCSMDFSSLNHHAMRGDGVWFSRSQYRDARYGYRWGAWRQSVAPVHLRTTGRKARLPR